MIAQTAVVDRFEDGALAVLLIGEEQRVVPVASLPPGVREGDWLIVQFVGDDLVHAESDREETQRAQQRVTEKMRRLRRRGRTPPPTSI